jgi:hypothetical protein
MFGAVDANGVAASPTKDGGSLGVSRAGIRSTDSLSKKSPSFSAPVGALSDQEGR